MLKVDEIHSGYGPIKILNGVSLYVDDSEIVGIIGPNGAGKSTCFKTIIGLVDTWEGSIELDGDDITDIAPETAIRRGISYVMQGQRIFPKMTVKENLEMGGYVLQDDSFREKADDVYDQFPALEEKRDTKARLLSGGQKKMLEIGMALMTDPKLLLMDEPSAGLAPAIRSDVFDIVKRLREEQGIPSLIIEQNITDLLESVDRAYVLDQGTTTMSGTGEQLLADEEVTDLYLGTG